MENCKPGVKIIIQSNDIYSNLWKDPHKFGGYYNKERYAEGEKPLECWWRYDKSSRKEGTLEEVIPGHWYPERLPHLRWWIEGENVEAKDGSPEKC